MLENVDYHPHGGYYICVLLLYMCPLTIYLSSYYTSSWWFMGGTKPNAFVGRYNKQLAQSTPQNPSVAR